MLSITMRGINASPAGLFLLSLSLSLLVGGCSQPPKEYEYPFQDPSLPTEERVDDLVGRLNLDEKIAQTMHDAPAISRLGIPSYNWWSEGLHGIARAGLATVFPQAIGMAATWDEEMMFRVSNVISDETRAKHHNFARNNKRFIYQGLTLWSPNINIFRDPRWGRGQETYGEDPFLTGKLAVQFIRGLQGDDPTYYKTIATVKHFAVHNGPEPERHVFDAKATKREMLDTYLPQFEMGIKEGKAYSLMCAYNRLNGEACCGSKGLLTELLRKKWDFNGFVVSDCGAIEDIYAHHKVVETPEEAAALGVQSGCDLNCGTVYANLKTAVEKGLITEKEIDIAVKRLFTARMKLGMFDPEDQVKYAQIPYSVVDSKPHQDMALEAARKSMVLLKNENHILPLNKDEIKTLAVIGPNADQWLMLLGNYNGVPSHSVTPLEGIKNKVGTKTKVLFAQGSELAEGMPMFYTIPASALFTASGKSGVDATYYNNIDFSGQATFTATEKNIDANWFDKAPREDMDDDGFSVVWNTVLKPTVTGVYQLGFIGTCNTQLFLNDSLIAETDYHTRNEYGDPRLRKSKGILLQAGNAYNIKVTAIETYADAQVQLVWAQPKPHLKEEAVRVAKQADVVVMCVGLTPRMEGEEMDIEIEGFRGGDRTSLGLPEAQLDLIKAIHALGKPVVLVLLNGSALAINWENENIPAILEAWYPGQAAGTAIADILFGDYNPAGRLPVTFYKSVRDLPPFDDYAVGKHTYRYFKGDVLYPFGYGLSYTNFAYQSLKSDSVVAIGDTVQISVEVTNTGDRAGDEVIQVYLSQPQGSGITPIRSLIGFKRIHFNPGETKTVDFSLFPNSFTQVDNTDKRVILPGKYQLFIGGGQPVGKQRTLSHTIVLE